MMFETTARMMVSGCDVPSTTPQSIMTWNGEPSCFGSVTRKQSPSPWRYMRTFIAAPAALCAGARRLAAPRPVDGRAAARRRRAFFGMTSKLLLPDMQQGERLLLRGAGIEAEIERAQA